MTAITIKLSDSEIKRQVKTKVNELNDPTLPLRVRFHKSRSKATIFLVEYIKGQGKWHRVGYWPQLTIKRVITHWAEIQKKFLLSGQVEFDAFYLVTDVLAWYRERVLSQANLSKHRKYNIKSVINKHLIPLLGHYQVKELTPEIIEEEFIWPLQNSYSLSTVQQYFKVLKRIFKQARLSKKLCNNPLLDIKLSDSLVGKVEVKACKIATHDIERVFNSMKLMPFEASFLVLTILCFGTRIGETRQMKITYLEHDQQQWHLPAKITKTNEPLVIPMSDWYLTLLNEYRKKQATINGYCGVYLFPNTKGYCINENTANDYVQYLSNRQWTAHDLRKLARTTWATLQVDYFVGEQLLNHKMKDLDAAYIHSTLNELKRKAINDWHFFLAQKKENKNLAYTKIT
jgi:integrase